MLDVIDTTEVDSGFCGDVFSIRSRIIIGALTFGEIVLVAFGETGFCRPIKCGRVMIVRGLVGTCGKVLLAL